MPGGVAAERFLFPAAACCPPTACLLPAACFLLPHAVCWLQPLPARSHFPTPCFLLPAHRLPDPLPAMNFLPRLAARGLKPSLRAAELEPRKPSLAFKPGWQNCFWQHTKCRPHNTPAPASDAFFYPPRVTPNIPTRSRASASEQRARVTQARTRRWAATCASRGSAVRTAFPLTILPLCPGFVEHSCVCILARCTRMTVWCA